MWIFYIFMIFLFSCDYNSDTSNEVTTGVPSSCDEVTAEASFSDVYAIMNQTSGKGCVNTSCHGGTRTPRLDQSEAQAQANIVNIKSLDGTRTYITANSLDSTQSLLYNKLSSSSPAVGVQMPKTGTKWEASDLQTLAKWICSGAK
jgi:hypothetical protein